MAVTPAVRTELQFHFRMDLHPLRQLPVGVIRPDAQIGIRIFLIDHFGNRADSFLESGGNILEAAGHGVASVQFPAFRAFAPASVHIHHAEIVVSLAMAGIQFPDNVIGHVAADFRIGNAILLAFDPFTVDQGEIFRMFVESRPGRHRLDKCQMAATNFRNALHFFPKAESGWMPKVLCYSGFYALGIKEVWDMIYQYIDFVKQNGYFEYRRNEQSKYWMYETINEQLKNSFYHNQLVENMLQKAEKSVLNGEQTSFAAAGMLLDTYFKQLKTKDL